MNRSKLVLVALAAAVSLVVSGSAFAGPPGDGAAVIFDWNADDKSDFGVVKTEDPNDGLVRNLLNDGTMQLDSGFTVILGSAFEPIAGVGFESNSTQAALLSRKTTDPNRGLVRLTKYDGTGLAVASNAFPAIVDPEFELFGIGDLDDDGIDDLVFWKTAGANLGLVRVFFLNEDGSVRESAFPTFIPAGFEAGGVADMDGDNNADLVAVKVSAPNAGLYRVFIVSEDGMSIESNTFPGFKPDGHTIIGIVPVNDDAFADVVLVKDGAPNENLVRVQLGVAGATGFMGSTFPLIAPTALAVFGAGNWDGVDGNGIAARNPTNGVFRVWNFTADGTGVVDTGFPWLVDPVFATIQNQDAISN